MMANNVLERLLRNTGEFEEDEIAETARCVLNVAETAKRMTTFDVSISRLLGLKKKEK